jgi:hypothetical protein
MFDSTPKTYPRITATETPERKRASHLGKLRIAERAIANRVINAKQPLIIIGEDSAESLAKMAFYMASTLPFVPVLFDTPTARKTFMKHVGDMRGYYNGVEVTKNQAKGVDCVMAFGSAIKPIYESGYFVYQTQPSHTNPQPRINFALIGAMKKTKGIEPDKTWLTQCKQNRPTPTIF